MNPYNLSDKDLLSAFDEYFIYLQSNTASTKEILTYNIICSEITQRKYTIKKAK